MLHRYFCPACGTYIVTENDRENIKCPTCRTELTVRIVTTTSISVSFTEGK